VKHLFHTSYIPVFHVDLSSVFSSELRFYSFTVLMTTVMNLKRCVTFCPILTKQRERCSQATSVKMTVFWDVAACSVVDTP
jgi:hypothetical protein